MRLSLNWLKQFVNIPKDLSAKKIADLITLHTAEVEEVIDQGKEFKNMVIGQIKQILPHPNADKLKICMTDTGDLVRKIVCGASNVKEGMLVAVALPGAYVRWHGEGEKVKLEKAKIRGEESDGMICAGEEIGLEPSLSYGILDLTHLKTKAGTPLASALGLDDIILDIENKSLTHRPDLWGHYGIARELASILKIKLKPLKIKKPERFGNEKFSITVENPKLCLRYMGVIINNIEIQDSPSWLKQKLSAIGIRPICNIVDATNYVMAEVGHPLHPFDKNLIEGGIIIRNANKNEKIITLDGQKRILDENMLVIADHKKSVAVAGVMGSEYAEINKNTTSIIFEAANFEKVNIRKTASKLGLRTEASQRYEKGIDPNLTEIALHHVIELTLKLCPKAEIASVINDSAHFTNSNKEIELSIDKVNSKIGSNLSKKEIVSILRSLEFTVRNINKNTLGFIPPTFRSQGDITSEDDLIEEIARIYGYDKIEPILPSLPIKLPEENYQRYLKHSARNILSYGLGFTEISTYSFYSKKDLEKCELSEQNHIKVQNYLSEDQTHMRASLLPNLLKAIANNLKYRNDFKIYEPGRTYQKLEAKSYQLTANYWPLEEKKIIGAIVKPKNYNKEIILDCKGTVSAFLNSFQFKNLYKFVTYSKLKTESSFLKAESCQLKANYIHPTKHLKICIDNHEIGMIYELHPQIAKNFDIEAKIGIFEINFAFVENNEICHPELVSRSRQEAHKPAHIASLVSKVPTYTPLPKYPGISFDVSAMISDNNLYENILNEIEKASPELIKNIKLIDLYSGAQIPEGKKSLTFRILLQSDEKTLTDQEMAEVQKKVFENLKKIGAEIRGFLNA